MTDKEVLMDVIIDRLATIPNKIIGINIGNQTKSYVKILLTKQMEKKYSFIDIFFEDGKLIDDKMFFDSVHEIIEGAQLKVLGVSLDNEFINVIQNDFNKKRASN